MPSPDSLAKRREPEQERSRAGVESILDAMAGLLDSQGIDQITMTAIATEAGLSKAAVYRYFPNKAAIIRALAERSLEEYAQLVAASLDAGSEDHRALVVDGFTGYLELHRSEPHRVQLRAAIRADPELSRLDLEDSRRNAQLIAQGLIDRGADLTLDTLTARVLLLLELTDGVIRLTSIVERDEADRVVREYLAMVADMIAGA